MRFGCTFVGVGIEGARFATVSAMSVNTRWLERMKSLTKLEKLKLQGCNRVDDESLAVLAAFPALRELDLKGTSVTEKGLAQISRGQTESRGLHRPMGRKSGGFSK